MAQKNLLIALVALLCAVCAQAAIQPDWSRDWSNRCSIVNTIDLGSFSSGTDSWEAANGCAASRYAQPIENHAAGSLVVTSKANEPGDTWRAVTRRFATPLNLSGKQLLQCHVLIPQAAPGRDNYLRLTLSDGSRSFTAQAGVIASLWRVVTFNVSACPFLNKVKSIELAAASDTTATWNNAAFYLDDICAGGALDLEFSIKGSEKCFHAQGGKVSYGDDALLFKFAGAGAKLYTTALKGSRNSIYNPPLGVYNTFHLVMANRSSATKARLYFTGGSSFQQAASKEFAIKPNSGFTSYYVNVSDVADSSGVTLAGLQLEAVDGKGGSWSISRINFLKADPLVAYAGKITSCTATSETVRIKGELADKGGYSTLAVYECPMYVSEGPLASLSGLKKLYEGPAGGNSFDIAIPNSRLGGKMTLLGTRMVAVVQDASGNAFRQVAPYFQVENWADFCPNPYAFELPARKFSALDYGAKGDGFTDDTQAINNAIAACSAAGGGQVVLKGDTAAAMGRRYMATNIIMKSNVDLHLEKGAVLQQSPDRRHYLYNVYYGHDLVIPGVNWTHSLLLNHPLIEGMRLENVKVTGPGRIEMNAPYTQNPDWTHYAQVCTDCIHIVPIAIVNSTNVEVSNTQVTRSNNWHTNFHGCSGVAVLNVKLYDPKCVSGDGYSFGQGTHNALVARCQLNSNDDGIVLSTSYKDPRGKIAPWRDDRDTADHSIRNVTVLYSIINSGGGKAIAFIPWGSTNPDQQRQVIEGITVKDCVLKGDYSVGTWPDNPFDGKPFTNSETNDFSPVYNVRIDSNEYLNACDMLCVTPTNFTGDTGIRSASNFVNGDFAQGSCYWTCEGDAGVDGGKGFACGGGRLAQGLYLERGKARLQASVKGKGKLVCVRMADSLAVASQSFNEANFAARTMELDLPGNADYFVGIIGDDAQAASMTIIRTQASDGIKSK